MNLRHLAIALIALVTFTTDASAAEQWYGTADGWGLMVDPDGDCSFTVAADRVEIGVPKTAHGMSIELKKMNAPRVVQSVTGSFDMQVQVGGKFDPREPTVKTRTAYSGGGLVLMQDDRNYVRLERAALRRGERVSHYVNFELRRDGRLLRFGAPADFSLGADDQLDLKVQVRGKAVQGFARKNGGAWKDLGVKEFAAVKPLTAGIAAINATDVPFNPVFESFRLTKVAEDRLELPGSTPPAEPGDLEKSDETPPLQIAVIHGADANAAPQFQKFLQQNEMKPRLVDVKGLQADKLAGVDLILVTSDTAGAWDNGDAANLIRQTGRPVMGLGEGGYQLLGKLGLAIGAPRGWHGTLTSARPVPGIKLWDDLGPAKDGGSHQLYEQSAHVGIHLPDPVEGVQPIGREPDNATHYVILSQEPHFLLWGFTGTPEQMTKVGGDVFVRSCAHVVAMDRPAEVELPDSTPKSPAMQHMAKTLQLGRQVMGLKQMKAQERKEFVDAVVELLKSRPEQVPVSIDSRLAYQLGRTLESLDDRDFAVATYNRMADAFSDASGENAERLANSLRGAARRADLPGNSMDLAGKTLDDQSFDWQSYRGKVVLVDFWASWCAPCRREIPNVLAQYEKYHEHGFDVVGICLDTDREKATSYVDDSEIPWPSLFAEKAGWEHPMAIKYGISAIPTAILVNREGKVVSLKARGEELQELLAGLIDLPEAESSAEDSTKAKSDSPDSEGGKDSEQDEGHSADTPSQSETEEESEEAAVATEADS
ncbi:TlpA family protein disulfide reductase [Roseiconus nitratireducens]|nr:TlpA disulfide reductase family protein [Roseiconus nitratireducens]